MAEITINSSIASLQSQRNLARASQDLSTSFTRLSSGLRINRASDDAAGLAIAENLNVDAKVYSQGVRNLNDGVSALSIADGALEELSNLITRQQELASEAANGVYSTKQRIALHREAISLVDEYNRIVQTVQFNNTNLLSSATQVRVQGGYGSSGGIGVVSGDELDRQIGTGLYQAAMSQMLGGGDFVFALNTGDFNNDGKEDIAYATDSGDVFVGRNNYSGSFTEIVAVGGGANNPVDLEVNDFNSDGNADIAVNNGATSVVYLGNGNNTFNGGFTVPGFAGNEFESGDLNNDGKIDLVGFSGTSIQVAFGNGNGTFKAAQNYASTLASVTDVNVGDFNTDGNLDIAFTRSAVVGFLYGTGTGSFAPVQTIAVAASGSMVKVADFNRDGNPDLLTSNGGNTFQVTIGNGNGTFQAALSIASSNTGGFISADDVNGDGFADLAMGGGGLTVALGNGDGTFRATGVSTSGINAYNGLFFVDATGDGVKDAVGIYNSVAGVQIANSNSTPSSLLSSYDLSSQSNARAAMDLLKTALNRVSSERGANGAYQSRITSATSILEQLRESFISAKSQITDADVAFESAQLMRNKILQQAGTAVLSQANLAPKIALTLLGVGD